MNTITLGNTQPPTSNAVAQALGSNIVIVWFEKYTTTGYFGIETTYHDSEYEAIGIAPYYQSQSYNANCASFSLQHNGHYNYWVYVRINTSYPPDNSYFTGYLILRKK